MANDIVQTIAEARVDARSLSEFVFKPAGFKVTRRLAPPVDTLQFYINRFNSLNGDFSSSVSVALSSLNSSVVEADGKVAYIETTVQDAINNTVISSGFVTIDSFELGATITERNQALRHAADGKLYRWAGDLPKTVPVGSTPTTSGGVGTNAWLEVSDNTLRQDIVSGDLITTASTKTVPIAGTFGEPRTQQDKNLENVSILDFFTQSERAEYEATPSTFDAYRPVQAFFDYIMVNKVNMPDASGHYYVSKGITYVYEGDTSNESKTTCIQGDFTLQVLGESRIDTLFHYASGRERSWIGVIKAIGNGKYVWSNRTVDVGIRIGGAKRASHNYFTKLIALDGFRQIGVYCDNLTSMTNFGQVQISDCGSGMSNTSYSVKANFNSREDYYVTSLAQHTWVTVDNLPPENLITNTLVIVDGYPDVYQILEVDKINSRIKLFSALDFDIEEGTLRYFFGAGVYIAGGDASMCSFEKVSGVRNNVVLWTAALYNPNVRNLLGEANGAALAIGASYTSASVGGSVVGIYSESVTHSIIRVTRASLSMSISGLSPVSFDRFTTVGAGRISPSNIKDRYNTLNGLYIDKDGFNQKESTLSMFEDMNVISANAGTSTTTIEIPKTNNNLFSLLNRDAVDVRVIAKAEPNLIPKGSIKFIVPQSYENEYTVNGTNEVSFSSFKSIPSFTISYDTSSNNYTVVPNHRSDLAITKGEATEAFLDVNYQNMPLPDPVDYNNFPVGSAYSALNGGANNPKLSGFGSNYWNVFTMKNGNTTGFRVQIAFGYGSQEIVVRFRHVSTWSDWKPLNPTPKTYTDTTSELPNLVVNSEGGLQRSTVDLSNELAGIKSRLQSLEQP